MTLLLKDIKFLPWGLLFLAMSRLFRLQSCKIVSSGFIASLSRIETLTKNKIATPVTKIKLQKIYIYKRSTTWELLYFHRYS